VATLGAQRGTSGTGGSGATTLRGGVATLIGGLGAVFVSVCLLLMAQSKI
jgi:hypothetical protein